MGSNLWILLSVLRDGFHPGQIDAWVRFRGFHVSDETVSEYSQLDTLTLAASAVSYCEPLGTLLAGSFFPRRLHLHSGSLLWVDRARKRRPLEFGLNAGRAFGFVCI